MLQDNTLGSLGVLVDILLLYEEIDNRFVIHFYRSNQSCLTLKLGFKGGKGGQHLNVSSPMTQRILS